MWSCCSPRSSSRPAAGASGPGRTQVSSLHLRVALGFGRGAGRDHAAEVEHVDPGADPHDQLHTVLDEQDGQAVPGQPLEQVGEGVGLVLVEAGRRLVEQQDGRLAGERPPDLDEPGQAGREALHPLIGDRPQPDPVEQLLGALGGWGAVLSGPAPAHVGRHAQVHEVQRLDAPEGHGDLLDLEERHGPHCRTRSRAPPRERQPGDDEGDGGRSVMGQQTFRRTLLVFVGLQLGQVMSSIDGTIVATALPTIAGDIGGFSRSTRVVTAYALAMVASMPIYGKLGDLYGRRRVLLAAIGIFLAGSMACGTAQTMDQLLASRFLQGLGGGGLGAVAMATVADIVPARQLGRWLGYQGVIYAVASAVGPVVGGLFVDHLSWRWAFLINLPIGLLAVLIVTTRLRLPYRRIPHAIDWSGSLLLTSGLALFVLLATLGGHEIPWASLQAAAAGGGLLLIAYLFVRRERRAPEPVLPLHLFANPVLRVAAGVNFTSGLLLWCGIFFVPQFVQQVRDVSPTRSGLVLMPLMFGTALGTLVTGRLVARTGRYRTWPIAGGSPMTTPLLLLSGLDQRSSIATAALSAVLLGTGAGFVMQPSLLAAQNSAEPRELGTATSTTLLFRTLGNTVGIPVFGGILNAGLQGTDLGPAAVASALRPVFTVAVLVGIAATLVAWRLPERPLREHTAFEGEGVARERVLLQTGADVPEAAPRGTNEMASATQTDERYTIISADCHAGGSHGAYREYLDPAFHEDFDAWRGRYKNPYKDLGDTRRLRNWDNEMRNSQQEADGVAGEVVFPNNGPPLFPHLVLFAKPPTHEEDRDPP